MSILSILFSKWALGYINVHTTRGDGYYGWQEHAPYDGIIVTAVTDTIPPPLVAQLKNNGRMIIPIGSPNMPQNLVLLKKIITERHRRYRFYPFGLCL
ncbi:hypothetical protein A9Q99_11605 [Gammaproteobacteria bacterium 45_16_T64]|nr:hypothetical protein A9Q99_11605 [Gammaproteobacteria bacterium 45_16_T64]